MADSDATDPDTGATAELARGETAGRLPVVLGDLSDQLPGLEPERRVTDWGRSERIEGLADRTVYDFLYHYWFRVEVEGIENVPREGAGLLVANHSGALPSDGAMIAKAIREEHRHPRSLHLTTDRQFADLPGLGMLATKLGAVTAHPANLHRLLFDERQLVLAFPEGHRVTGKPLKERYRLRSFGRAAFVQDAMRAGAPIIPVAVLGAEEALPVFARTDVFARIDALRRLTRLPSLPVTPAFPLPAKFRIRFLEPVLTEGLGEAPWREKGLVQSLGSDIRALIQENLLEMVAGRRSVWLG